MPHSLTRLRQHQELWDLFTRKEEYSPKELDKHHRFLHAYSAFRDVQAPAVSKFLLENGLEVEYPEGKPFAVCLTHDVDFIYPPLQHTLLSTVTCIKEQELSRAKDQLFWRLQGNGRSPYRRFEEIMDLEEKYGANSSFFFLATDADISHLRYNIEELGADLGQISDRNHEVGLHGGYYAYNDLEAIQREKARLERVLNASVIGYRGHFLRFNVPDTWNYLYKAGFKYDTTLGYRDAVGFRNGMSHPYYPVDLNEGGSVLPILEIPLIIMDGTLFDSVNSFDEAFAVAKKLVDVVEAHNGVLTVCWHSNSFNCPYRKSWDKLYEALLKYCWKKNAWLTDAACVYHWWKREHNHINM